jgi:hypothetical protein
MQKDITLEEEVVNSLPKEKVLNIAPTININKAKKKVKTITKSKSSLSPINDQELEQIKKYLENVENDWQIKVKSYFSKELALPESTTNQYFELRDRYEEEKTSASEEFHARKQREQGDDYTYRATEEQQAFEKKYLKIYLTELKELLGKKEYKKYLRLRDEFNEELKSEQNPEAGMLLIEI